MAIVGFNFSKIGAEIRNDKFSGNIDIKMSLPVIKNVEKKGDVAGLKDIIAIEFTMNFSYEPKIGQIDFTGELLYQGEKSAKVMKTWKEKKILDSEVALDIYNYIFRRCVIKAFALADDVRLPPPLTVPLLTKEEPKKMATAG